MNTARLFFWHSFHISGGELLTSTGMVESSKKGAEIIEKTLQNGTAKRKFIDMMCSQGVNRDDASVLCKEDGDPFCLLQPAQNKTEIKSKLAGTYC